MSSLSLCMIVKNEEEVIARCLDSIKDIVDEIIIVDTGSTDKTKEIVSKYTDKIYDFEWINDFSAARNYSFSKATKDYIMWLDADDVIKDADRIKLKEAKNNLNSSVNMVMLKYNVAFDENNNPTLSYYRERILETRMAYKWVGRVHEVIVPAGNVIYNDAAVTHMKARNDDSKRNLDIYESIIKSGEKLDPRGQFYYARELYYNKRFDDAIKEFNDFLDSNEGWIENNISACQDLAYCYYDINDEKRALEALLKSLFYDEPRAEICCEIGKHFFDRGQYQIAIFWYKLAITREAKDKNGGFYKADCYNYIPYIQLCVCYDRLSNTKLAIFYNDLAASVKPNDVAVLHNKRYLNRLIKSEIIY